MKKQILTLALLAALVPIGAHAGLVATNAITLQSIATTTVNGLTNTVPGVVLPARSYLIQNTGIPGVATGTNALTVNIQASFDGVNWTTVATYHPSSTNATVDTYAPNVNAVTAYTRIQAVTTNTVTVGVTSVYQQ